MNVIDARRLRLERQLQSHVAAIFQRQRKQFNIDALLQRATVSEAQPIRDELYDLITMMWPDMSEQLAVAIARDAVLAARLIGNLTLASIGYSQSFTIATPVRDRLATGSLVASYGIEETSKQRVRTILTRGFVNEWDTRKIARELRTEMGGWSKRRAEMIARTEISEAWNSTQYEVLARNGWERRVWLSAEDERVDYGDPSGPCVQNAEAGAVPMLQPFPSGAYYPPTHPRCRCSVSPAPGFGPGEREPWTGDTVTEFRMPERVIPGV